MSYHKELLKQEKKAVDELSEKYDDYLTILFAIALSDRRKDWKHNEVKKQSEKLKKYNAKFSKDQVNTAFVRSYDIAFAEFAKDRRELSEKDKAKIDVLTATFLGSLNGMADGYAGKANQAINKRDLEKLMGTDARYNQKATMSLRDNKGRLINSKNLTEAYITAGVWGSGNTGYATSLEKIGIKRVRYKTQEDERVCEICGPKNDEVYELPEDYAEMPPMHPFCRCFLEPVQ